MNGMPNVSISTNVTSVPPEVVYTSAGVTSSPHWSSYVNGSGNQTIVKPPRPTVSLDAGPIVTPILTCMFTFPLLVLAVICGLRYRARKARERERMLRQQRGSACPMGIPSFVQDLPSFLIAGAREILSMESDSRPSDSESTTQITTAGCSSSSGSGPERSQSASAGLDRQAARAGMFLMPPSFTIHAFSSASSGSSTSSKTTSGRSSWSHVERDDSSFFEAEQSTCEPE